MNLQSEGDEQVTNTMPLGDDDQVTGIASLEGGGEGGLMGDVQIEFVEALGIAILKGPKRDVERVQEVIKSIIDQSSKTQPEIEVVPLQHVNSEAVSTVVKQLYEEVLAARQGQVSITPLVQPNSLLLIGRAEAILSLKDLLSKLDQPLDPTSQLRVFRLLYASATDASETIDQFFQTAEGTDAPVGLATRVSVVPDFRTNSLIVQASPRDLAEVSRLISEIDVENTAAESAVRVFPLKNALAEELEPVLQAAIGASNQDDGDARPPSNKIVIKTLNGTDLDSGILSGVVVTANPSINSLVVRAPSSSMPLIAELISQLDQLPGAEALIKVFTVENADATTLAQTVQQLFGLAQTAGNNSTGGIFGGNNSAAAAISALSAGGESSLVQLRVAVDARTNSIIVSGSPSDLEVIEVLLLRLDEDAVEERRSQVVWLRNSNAVDIATAIQQFVVNQLQNVQQSTFQGQSLRPDEQFGREILVQAEPSTNSLIVSATPRYIDEVMEIIRRLDRRPPMIHVEVLLAEVTLDDTFEFGVEWGLQDALLFDRGSATGGTLGSPAFNIGAPLTNLVTAGQPSQAAGQGISSFALGRTNSTLGYGGLVLSAASDSISALLRTLQDANRLQILSRPSVTTVDNVEGFVQVGAQVPRIQNVTPGNQFAGQSISIEDVNIGLILRILPRTNEDGLILLNVSIERSSLRNDDTGIPVGFGPDGEVIRSPIINTTRATSRISAYDGQTVVYAGLISKARTSRTRRIPFLADIPLAGALFRFDTETESRTELLVVLTPRIINSDVALDTMNQVESSRMSWCLADVLNIHGDTSLSPGNGLWGPAASPVIYPDLQPTVMGEEIIPDSVFIGDAQTVAPNGMMSPNGVEPLNIPQINSYPNYSPGGMIPNANRSGSNGSLLEQPAINEAPEFTPPNY
jgi:type II secretion system protein D